MKIKTTYNITFDTDEAILAATTAKPNETININDSKMPKIVASYGLTALVLLITSFFIKGDLDIVSHDTYYVIAYAHICILLAMIFALFTIITWGIGKMGRILSPILNWMHYGISMICLLLLIVFYYKLTNQTRTYEDYSVYGIIDKYESQISLYEWAAIIALVLVLSQALFISNVVRAFIVKKPTLP